MLRQLCMKCGEELDWVYSSRNPDYQDWELCASCVKECDAEMAPAVDKGKEQAKKPEP